MISIFDTDVSFQASLFEERDVGMLMALVTLLLGIVARSYEGFESLVPRVVNLLSRLVKKDVGADYHYYGIPSPWLQVLALSAPKSFDMIIVSRHRALNKSASPPLDVSCYQVSLFLSKKVVTDRFCHLAVFWRSLAIT